MSSRKEQIRKDAIDQIKYSEDGHRVDLDLKIRAYGPTAGNPNGYVTVNGTWINERDPLGLAEALVVRANVFLAEVAKHRRHGQRDAA